MEVFYVTIKTEGLGADGKIKVDYQYVADTQPVVF